MRWFLAGMLAPPPPAQPRPAEKQAAPPRPVEIDKTRGVQRGKTDCRLQDLDLIPLFITSTNFVSEEERVEKDFHLTFLQLVTIFFTQIPFKSERMYCFP